MRTSFDHLRHSSLRFIVVVAAALACGGCVSPLIANLDAFRAAKKRGDYAEAGKYLAEDARIWFDKKEGSGSPYSAKGGPYKGWDREFNSSSTREQERTDNRTVSYISTEMNDFYRLIERQPTPARVTWYFDEDQRITGMLYQGLGRERPGPPDRQGEFEQWAAKRYPGLLDSPEMKIPNNPKRWRELLVEWRDDVGLPPID